MFDDYEVLEFVNPYLRLLDERNDRKEIVIRHGHIAITNYELGDNTSFEKLLSVWDPVGWKYHQAAGFYIKKLKEFRIGRGFDLYKLQRLFPNRTIRYDDRPYMADKFDYELRANPINDFQRVALTFMASQTPYKANEKFTQQLITAPTGSGKTYCGVAISAYFHARVVIVCPISKLYEQWKQSFLDFTTLEEDQIMIVKGSAMCEKIRQGECKDIVAFIFSADTIVSYIDNYGIQACIEMLLQTRAYIKIIDEIHKDMRAVSAIEAVSNFQLNFYMSASPRRSDEKENYIFSLMYKNVPKFGKDFAQPEERHINVVVKQYKFFPTDVQIKQMYRPKVGLNTRSYEKVLLTAEPYQMSSFIESVNTMLNWSKDLVKKDNKILILCQTVDGTLFMEKLANKIFPKQCSHYYATGMSKKEKEQALEKRVICATSSSMGTGADIKNLQHVINICTYANEIDATQLPGRARKLKDGTPVVYIELVNMGYRKTASQYERRRKYLANNAVNGKIMTIR